MCLPVIVANPRVATPTDIDVYSRMKYTHRMNTLKPEAIAYVAAMIDAEGCIRISKAKNPYKTKPWLFRPWVQVVNSHAGLIGFLHKLTGVGLVYHGKKPQKENWSPIHRWQVSSNHAKQLIAVVVPYLVIKREIAELVLQFPTMPQDTPFAQRAEFDAKQCSVWEQVKALNERGFGNSKTTKTMSDFPADHPLLPTD